MKAVHGGNAKNDKIDSPKIASLLRGGRMGLHESMKRFDDVRCKTVASQPPREHGVARNVDQHEASKDLLH